jgi:membrane peptidoglycan carboxypeptidase
MAFAEQVWGHLARLELPRRRRGRRYRDWRPRFITLPRAVMVLRLATLAAIVLLLGRAALYEMRTSYLEAGYFTRLDQGMNVKTEAGPSNSIRFPKAGPYDERFGYTALPKFISSLTADGFAVESQARWSDGLSKFVGRGNFPIYREKDRAGLSITDRSGGEVYKARFPEKGYADFASTPPLVANSLLFIEDRYMFDGNPEHNAAVEWNRFALAAIGRIARLIVPGINEGGGSTLATQIEKFRHSPHGQTGGVGDKLRQMMSASARIYMDGHNTVARRHEVVTTYLNSTPLASMPGYGEVIGVPEALWVWFGTKSADADKILDGKPRNAAELAQKGLVYRQVLSLILSERRPSYYLLNDRAALETLTDRYLRLLWEAGIIDTPLRNAALAAQLDFRDQPPPLTTAAAVRQKATEDIRNKLVSLLKLPDLYALDRLDVSAETTIDTATQDRVMAVLQQLSDPKFLQASGMMGKQLLTPGTPLNKVTYSFVLYERGAHGNYLRVRADSQNKPFDINSDGKLMLGSTAKLRTLATYLQIVDDLHQRFLGKPPRELARIAATAQDPLTGWAAGYMARSRDSGLQPMLDAAMERHYSAAPGSFFTGGGTQSFGNFESTEDGGEPTLTDAFRHSVNLAFIRLMRDIVTYYNAQSGADVAHLLADPSDPNRAAYLQRFIEADSKHFLYRYFKDFKGLDQTQMLDLMVHRAKPISTRLASIYLTMHPDARIAEFKKFITAQVPGDELTEDKIWHEFVTYSPYHLSLKDRAFISGIHPLELWLATYLQEHPDASWNEVFDASAEVRRQAYGWLFKGNPHKQDLRIKILLEQDGFSHILDHWKTLGYPFSHLVPSLGTVIGASGDRPDALAQLMGIILNDGVKLPNEAIKRLRFAEGTPYQTTLVRGAEPQRVMAPEIARTLRRVLSAVVADGTASRLRGVYAAADGSPLPVGGKTGTGDNRFERHGAGGALISSRSVDRTATFVFFLGDRFYGTVTAYVPGQDAARFTFTSALAVQLLKVLQPELRPLMGDVNAVAAQPATPAKPS